jgi:hypothetical protein
MATNTRGQQPARQSPARARNGRGEPGLDPTEQIGQTPGDIFGFTQTYNTGARGSSGAAEGSRDVTTERGQIDPGLAMVTKAEITQTGAPGSQGARLSGGGEAVTYTDPFAYPGGADGNQISTRGQIDGAGEWTAFGEDSGFSGPTLPVLQNARPTSTGAGQGRIRGAGKGL